MEGESGIDHARQLSEMLENQRIVGDMTDITVVCEGREFKAHKMILNAVSPYFKAMLKPEWDDNKSGRIELPTVSAKEMDTILPFLYRGKVKEINDPDLIKKLLTSSHMMQIDGLFEYCYKKLCEGLSCDNFLEIYNLTCLYNHSGMTELVVTFLEKHFLEISRGDEFKQLTPHQLLKIVQNVDINDDVIEGLLKWAEVEESRVDSLLHIFTSADLRNVTTEYLMNLISERTLVKKNLHILTLLTANATTRTYYEGVKEYRLCCFGKKDNHQVCRMYDIKENNWLSPHALPFNLNIGMAIVSFRKHIWFVGGGNYPSYTPSTQVKKYNPSTNSVVSERNLSIPVCHAGLGVLKNSIYVINGWNENKEPVRTVQRYNPATNTCDEVAPTNNARCMPNVVTYAGYLYVVGSGSFTAENSVERYEHETNTWSIITNIPGTMHYGSSAIFKERLFVNPSYQSNELRVYDFTSKTWTAMKLLGLTESIFRLYSTTLNGKALLLIHDAKNVIRVYEAGTKQLLRKSVANEEPWWSSKTCVN